MKYQILGETLPVVVCQLEGGEKMITEGGGMSWMSPNMLMETTTNGGIGKAFGRMFSGEKMFQNVYTAQGNDRIRIKLPGFHQSIRDCPGTGDDLPEERVPGGRGRSRAVCIL